MLNLLMKASIGKGCKILWGAKARGRVRIGDGCHIGRNVELFGDIWIEDNVDIGDNVKIYGDVRISGNVTIGAGSYLNGKIVVLAGAWISRGCDICGHVTIYKAILAPRVVCIGSPNHARNELGEYTMSGEKVLDGETEICIYRGAWIGHSAIILKGVRILPNTVVGAGSVVTKSIDDPALVGNPAHPIEKKIKPYDDEISWQCEKCGLRYPKNQR